MIELLDSEDTPELPDRPPTPDPIQRQLREKQLEDWIRENDKVELKRMLDKVASLKSEGMLDQDSLPQSSSDGDASEDVATPHGTTDPGQPDNPSTVSTGEERAIQSFPSTRRPSLERGRARSKSTISGLGIVVADRTSVNSSQSMSPLDGQPSRQLSWKHVAVTPPTPPMQPGEIVEIVPKENDGEGKGGQLATVVRKKDPWRVPSAEQPWGTGNQAEGKLPTDTPDPH